MHLKLIAGTAVVLSVLLLPDRSAISASDDTRPERAQMVRTIERHAENLDHVIGEDGLSPDVLAVMGDIERHLFVPNRWRYVAYADRPVEIGYGQTISQPFIVALMTHLLAPKEQDVMLEIGTGSGYQAAVLARLVDRVCTIEIISGLGESAAALLKKEGYDDVEVKVADGYFGWPDCGPFDGIVVTAAISHVPPPLIEQLKPGGRVVIPVGDAFSVQMLTVVEKSETGEVSSRHILPVRFVPFTRN